MMHRNKHHMHALWVALCAVLILSVSALAATPAQDVPVGEATLANLTYVSQLGPEDGFALTDGVFTDDETTTNVELETESTAWGDLDEDGDIDALVVLSVDTGGTARWLELFAVLDEDGEATPVASTLLGDRVVINEIRIGESGIVTVDLITHGPLDADCCPNTAVIRHYAFDVDALNLIDESAADDSAETPGGFAPLSAWDADADPTSMTINLGGGEGMWLDPTIVSAISGVVTGADRTDASGLGIECAGVVSVAPEIVVNWTADENVETLRFFLLSNGDPSLIVVTPSGEVLCNDDLNPLELNPMIAVEEPEEGRYAIYVGSFEDAPAFPGFLVITAADTNPAAFRLGDLVPALPTNSLAIPVSLPLETLTPEEGPDTVELTADDVPFTVDVVAGGDVHAFDVETGNPLCTGFVTAEPTFRFTWESEGEGNVEKLVIFAEADQDTTLIVLDPNGNFQCIDDADGADNLNPWDFYTPIPGDYAVWLGTFAPDVTVDAVLTISGDPEQRPVELPTE